MKPNKMKCNRALKWNLGMCERKEQPILLSVQLWPLYAVVSHSANCVPNCTENKLTARVLVRRESCRVIVGKENEGGRAIKAGGSSNKIFMKRSLCRKWRSSEQRLLWKFFKWVILGWWLELATHRHVRYLVCAAYKMRRLGLECGAKRSII